jgi:hypothetical protein
VALPALRCVTDTHHGCIPGERGKSILVHIETYKSLKKREKKRKNEKMKK